MGTIPEPNSPSRPWEYDAFFSYSTGPNYKLALKLEEFIEGFREEKGIREHRLRPLRICADGSDFNLPRGCRHSRCLGKARKADRLPAEHPIAAFAGSR